MTGTNAIELIPGRYQTIREYDGQRVVTFKDVDTVHERAEGTARRNFSKNKAHFIEGTDFYKAGPGNIQLDEIRTVGIDKPNNVSLTLITESGYLMLVKSFTDDLAWKVQRALVNTYFRAKVEPEALPVLKEPQRALTVDDYLRAASIVGSCRNERLPIVVELIRNAGLEIPELKLMAAKRQETLKTEKDVEGRAAAYINAAHNNFDIPINEIAEMTGLNRSLICHYRSGLRMPSVTQMQIIINAIRQKVPGIDDVVNSTSKTA